MAEHERGLGSSQKSESLCNGAVALKEHHGVILSWNENIGKQGKELFFLPIPFLLSSDKHNCWAEPSGRAPASHRGHLSPPR